MPSPLCQQWASGVIESITLLQTCCIYPPSTSCQLSSLSQRLLRVNYNSTPICLLFDLLSTSCCLFVEMMKLDKNWTCKLLKLKKIWTVKMPGPACRASALAN